MSGVSLASMAGRVSSQAAEIGSLIDQFEVDAPSALGAVVTDRTGLPLVWSGSLPEETTDHFAAIILGLASLATSAAQCFAGDRCERQLLELDSEFVFVEHLAGRGLLGVVADKRADLGAIGYEVTLLGTRLAARLDDEVVTELAGRVRRP